MSLNRRLSILLLSALLCASYIVAGEPGNAPPMAATCDACHGVSAPSPFADVPTIHGQSTEVIENALYDFRAGLRPCRVSACSEAGDCPDTDMCSLTTDMDAEEIAGLARWYAGKRFVAADEPYVPASLLQGRAIHENRCEACHTDGGITGIEQASRLRGQRKDYLRLALDDFRNSRRTPAGAMGEGIKQLTDEEIAELVEFYASPSE